MSLKIISLTLASFLFASCINNIEDISGGQTFDPADISFSADIQPIFTSSCTPCHISTTTNGVNLSSYASVRNSIGIGYESLVVIPGNPDASPIIDKIEPNPERGQRMPLTGSYLTASEINKIRAWIEAGAEDN